MNRKLAAVVSVTAVGVAMAGCSSGGGSDPDTLTVMTLVQAGTESGDALDQFIGDFEAETGATVELTRVGEDLPDVYETSVAGNTEADVVMVNLAERSTTWVEDGIAIPASDYLDDWGLTERINPDALEAWTNEDGQVQGFPYDGFTWPVWYNMELLRAAGIDEVPATIDDLLDVVAQLREAGTPPMVIGGLDWSGQKLFLQIAQSYMSPDEATQVFSEGGYCASENAMRGIGLFTQLRDAGLFVDDAQGYTADQMNAAFFGGDAAMMSAGSWGFGAAPAELHEQIYLGGFPVPSDGAYEMPTAYEGYTGQGFFISPNGAEDEKIDLVQQFITAWYTPEVATAWSAATNGPTAVVVDASSGTIENSVTAQAVNDLPERVAFALMPDTVVPGPVSDPMIRQTSVAFAPDTQPDAICSALDGLYD